MNERLFHAFVLLVVITLVTGTPEADSQTNAAQLTLLDTSGQPVSSIIDGNLVQLRIELGAGEQAEAKVSVHSPDLPRLLAECIIEAGQTHAIPLHSMPWAGSGERMAM